MHIHSYTYIHTYIYLYVCTHPHTHAHTYIHTNVCIHVNTYTHPYTHTNTHTHTYTHTPTLKHTYIHTHTHTHPEDSVNNDFIFPISTIPNLFVPLNPSGCRDLQEKWIKARNGALLIYLCIPRLVPDGILGGSLRWTM